MSESPRWERESHEDLGAPVHPPQDTVEMELPVPLGVDVDELRDPPEFPGRPEHDVDVDADVVAGDDFGESPRLNGARESLVAGRESLAAGRESARESLVAGRESAREALAATRAGTARRLSATRASARVAAAAARVSMSEAAETLSDGAGRAGRWVAALDRRPEFDAGARRDPVAELAAGPDSLPVGGSPVVPDWSPVIAGGSPVTAADAAGAGTALPAAGGSPVTAADAAAAGTALLAADAGTRAADAGASMPAADAGTAAGNTWPAVAGPARSHGHVARFPIALRGYDRESVDRHVNELELALARLRTRVGPMSISEEIERLGEQAASILVTAHDTASETSRRAQEQAARAVTEAADDAQRITADAERRLRELDEETDAVWRERERLLGDVRAVSATLARLAATATERFPAAEGAPAHDAVPVVAE